MSYDVQKVFQNVLSGVLKGLLSGDEHNLQSLPLP